MYDGLTPLFDHVTGADFNKYFKSERFGIGTDGPGTAETVPHAGRDDRARQFNVPHVNATNYDGGIWAAGWIAAEDRGLLLQQARYNARVAAIDAPGLSALGLIVGLQNFQPSAQTEAEIAKQTQALKHAGPGGRGGAERHRHVHLRHQRLPGGPQPLDHALDPQRRLRAERAQGPVRRARAAATRHVARSSWAASSSASVGTGARASSTTCVSSRTPTARPRSTAHSTTGRSPSAQPATSILDPGSFQTTPVGGHAATSASRRALSPLAPATR